MLGREAGWIVTAGTKKARALIACVFVVSDWRPLGLYDAACLCTEFVIPTTSSFSAFSLASLASRQPVVPGQAPPEGPRWASPLPPSTASRDLITLARSALQIRCFWGQTVQVGCARLITGRCASRRARTPRWITTMKTEKNPFSNLYHRPPGRLCFKLARLKWTGKHRGFSPKVSCYFSPLGSLKLLG